MCHASTREKSEKFLFAEQMSNELIQSLCPKIFKRVNLYPNKMKYIYQIAMGPKQFKINRGNKNNYFQLNKINSIKL